MKLNVEFTPEATTALERLAETMGTTKAGVLRYGLSLVATIAREEREGNALAVIRGERVVKELTNPWCVRI